MVHCRAKRTKKLDPSGDIYPNISKKLNRRSDQEVGLYLGNGASHSKSDRSLGHLGYLVSIHNIDMDKKVK